MHKTVAVRFGLRWLVSSLGLYVAAALLGASRLSVEGNWWTVVIAGLSKTLALP
jgi:membrane-associated phospholipid phosphatase